MDDNLNVSSDEIQDQLSLFTQNAEAEQVSGIMRSHQNAGDCQLEPMILEDNGLLFLITSVFADGHAARLQTALTASIQWQQDSLRFSGKNVLIPRLQAWYGDEGTDYSYSGLSMAPKPLTEELTEIRQVVTAVTQAVFNPAGAGQPRCQFNSVLCNLYRDENDSVGWHSDNEKELGTNPVIASVSFGATRPFHLKHRRKKEYRFALPLPHNSLLIMAGELQHHWYHQIAKSTKPIGPRINLTFRTIQR